MITLSDLKIADKYGNLIPLTMNPVQRQLLHELGIDPDDPKPSIRGKMLRKRILKARREGVTTILLALYFIDTYNYDHTRTCSIAHDLESTESIFEIVTRFYDNLPDEKKIPADRSNTREIYWSSIDSRIYVLTAGKKNAGSGSTIHNIHKSERAKWALTPAQIRALDASLDEAGSHANIIEETTAQGLNHFHDEWNASVSGKNAYQAIFFPWFADPTYRTPVPDGFEMTKEERDRATAYSLDAEQIYWYRMKEQDRTVLMPQEYPHNPREAFIASGYPVFSRAKLQAISDRIDSLPGPIPDLVIPRDFLKLRQAYEENAFLIYRMPQIEQCRDCGGAGRFVDMVRGTETCGRCTGSGVVAHQYLITADTAEGIDPAKGDFDAAAVWDIDTWEEVATLYGKWDTRHYGYLLADLGWLYGEGLVTIEDNNHGHAVIQACQDAGYPDQYGTSCQGLYYHRPELIDMDFDVTASAVMKPGWPTTVKTKRFAIKLLASAIEDGDLRLRDPQTVAELMTYVNKGGGTMGGEGNAHDDRVTRTFLAAALLSLRYTRKSYTRGNRKLQPVEPTEGYGSSSRVRR